MFEGSIPLLIKTGAIGLTVLIIVAIYYGAKNLFKKA
jgi:hypothetical protein